jgi:hypothetical protein
MSKNSPSVEAANPLRSPCKLLRLIETVTPETEYWGFTVDSSLTLVVFVNFYMYL